MRLSLGKLTSFFLFLYPVFLVIPLKISLNKQVFFHPLELLILLFVLVFFFIYIYENHEPLARRHFSKFIYIAAFIIFVTLSCMFTSLSKEGAIFIFRLIYLFTLFYLLLVIKPSINISAVTSGLIVSSIFLSLYIIIDSCILSTYTQRPGDLLLGGAVGLIPSIALGILFIKAVINCKPFYIPTILLLVIALYLNGTRTWMLSATAAFMFIVLFSSRYKFSIITKRVIVLSLPLVILGLFYILSFKIRLTSDRLLDIYLLLSGDIESTTLGTRFIKWYLGMQEYLNSPIWGTGMFNLNLGMPSWVSELSNQRSDNQFLDLLYMCGPVPFVMFNIFLLYYLIKFMFVRYLDADGLIAIFILANLYVASFLWAILDGYILYGVFYLIFVSVIILSDKFSRSTQTNRTCMQSDQL